MMADDTSGGGSCSSVTGVKRPAAGSSAAAYHDGNTRVGEAPAKRMAVADGRPSIRSALSTAVSTGRLAGHTAAATPTSATVRRGSASVLPATSSAPPLVSSAIKRALVTGRATTLK
ncbi:hypothetical protein EON62_04125 [archaeon]|nr:MAG: hypothetical protein EON62_04125 [archaeon]